MRKSCNKNLKLRLPLLKKTLHVFLDPDFHRMQWWTFLYGFWCRRYLETKIWGDLLGFAIVTSGYIRQWTDQPCPLGRMHQRLPSLGKRWQTRKRDGRSGHETSEGWGEEICSQRWSLMVGTTCCITYCNCIIFTVVIYLYVPQPPNLLDTWSYVCSTRAVHPKPTTGYSKNPDKSLKQENYLFPIPSQFLHHRGCIKH